MLRWKSSVSTLGVPAQDMTAPAPTEFGEVEQYSIGSGHCAKEVFAVSAVRAMAVSGTKREMVSMRKPPMGWGSIEHCALR